VAENFVKRVIPMSARQSRAGQSGNAGQGEERIEGYALPCNPVTTWHPRKSCYSETIFGYNTAAMLNRVCCAIVSAGVLALFLCLTVVGQTYTVRLTRPWKAGDRYSISATGSVSQLVGGGVGEMMSNDRLDERSV